MVRLFVLTSSVMLRRVSGTANFRGPRWLLYGFVVLLACLISTQQTVAAYDQYKSGTGVGSFLIPPIIAIIIFVVSGILAILTEAVRDRSGRVEGALSNLPLSRRAIVALTWLPTAALMGLLAALLVGPATGALVGLGLSLWAALNAVLCLLAFGGFIGAMSLVVAFVFLKGARWNAVRYPVAMLVWLAFAVAEIATSVNAIAGHQSGDSFLVLPAAMSGLVSKQGMDPLVSLLCYALGLAGVIALFAVMTGRSFGRSDQSVRILWGTTGSSTRAFGELLYFLRDPSTVANLISGFFVSCAISFIAWKLPVAVDSKVVGVSAIGIALFSTIPVRGLRGIFDRKYPPQRLIGMSVRSWVTTQNLAGAALTAFGALPGLALLWLPDTNWQTTLMTLLSAILISFGCACFFGWLFPVQGDNAMGQVLAALLSAGVAITLINSVSNLLAESPLVVLLGSAAFIVLTDLLATYIELNRWRVRLDPSAPHPN